MLNRQGELTSCQLDCEIVEALGCLRHWDVMEMISSWEV
jgi:hypothetical protein